MKTIGILGGMTWESSVTYYRVVNEYISKSLGGLHSARCLLHSVDFEDIHETQVSGDWARAAELLSDAGCKLREAGADFLIIATNTMHIVAPEVEQATGLPLLHIADVTARRLVEDGIAKVGLLGTKITMEMDFYKDLLRDQGIATIVPDEADREDIDRIIMEELALGIIHEGSRRRYRTVIDSLAAQGARAVILGCTEIGLLIQQEHSALPVYDTALIHAEEAAKYALKD